jgi:hypothetical protein
MLDRPIDTLGEPDLQRLVENHVAEGRNIEFKRDLPGGSDGDRRKFLWNVTSFANAQGGDLIYGVDAPRGIATSVPGIETDDPDAAIQRLDSMLQTGVSPRLAGVRMRWVPLANERGVLVVRIPAGIAAPHRETLHGEGRFYTRNNAGKQEMDVHDLRHAFTEAGSVPSRFRKLHAEAIERARGSGMPLSINAEPTAVVSVMPLALFREERDIPITGDHALAPVGGHGYSHIDMIEGVLLHSPIREGSLSVRSFALTYRSGRADIAWTIGGRREVEGRKLNLVFVAAFESGLLEAANATQTRLRQFNVEGPWVVFASVYGVQNHVFGLSHGETTRAAYRDEALLGELRIERIDEEALLPIAKNFWLLFGEQRPDGRPMNKR